MPAAQIRFPSKNHLDHHQNDAEKEHDAQRSQVHGGIDAFFHGKVVFLRQQCRTFPGGTNGQETEQDTDKQYQKQEQRPVCLERLVRPDLHGEQSEQHNVIQHPAENGRDQRTAPENGNAGNDGECQFHQNRCPAVRNAHCQDRREDDGVPVAELPQYVKDFSVEKQLFADADRQQFKDQIDHLIRRPHIGYGVIRLAQRAVAEEVDGREQHPHVGHGKDNQRDRNGRREFPWGIRFQMKCHTPWHPESQPENQDRHQIFQNGFGVALHLLSR